MIFYRRNYLYSFFSIYWIFNFGYVLKMTSYTCKILSYTVFFFILTELQIKNNFSEIFVLRAR